MIHRPTEGNRTVATETLTNPAEIPDHTSPQADVATSAASRADEPRGEDASEQREQAGVSHDPKASREARLEAAKKVRLSRSPNAHEGSPNGQETGGKPKDATGKTPREEKTDAAPLAGSDKGEVAQASALNYGKHTAKDQTELEALMRSGQRLRLEMGKHGDKIARGEPLTSTEMLELVEHFKTRESGIQKKLEEARKAAGANGSPAPTTSQASHQQPQPKPGERGQAPAGSSTSASPAMQDGLDEETLAVLDEADAKKIRAAFDATRARLSELEAQNSQAQEALAQRAAERTKLGDLNFAMAIGVLKGRTPDMEKHLSDVTTCNAIFDKLEAWGVTEDDFVKGGPEFMRTVEEAATLVLHPSRTQQAHADLLARTAAERAGTPQRPIIGRQAPQTQATYTRNGARQEIAKITNSNLSPGEKAERIEAVKLAYQAGKAAAASKV